MTAIDEQNTDRKGNAMTATGNAINWTEIDGGVCAPRGFRASGLPCGIRARRPDLALLVADRLASAAGVFTTNRLCAAPVIVCREQLRSSGGKALGVIINSGNANACTGSEGMSHARTMVSTTARAIGAADEHVLVCSTGVIGVKLPMEKVSAGIPKVVEALAHSPAAAKAASDAILTTDNGPKVVALEVTTPAGTFRIGAMAKGAGMIHPNMATTLAFVTTDAPIHPAQLQSTLRAATNRTFNCISVDGECSTNDTIIALALGRDGLDADAFAPASEGLHAFAAALEEVLRRLAQMIVADGEGATRVMDVRVHGAVTEAEAMKAARAIANSLLVKTAIHGADANWGRIASAVGASGVAMVPDQLSISIAGMPMLQPGFVSHVDEAEARQRMAGKVIAIEIDLGAGSAEARMWASDLSAEYVRINADYRS
ncbi:MAG: bifunctional glutamate N-acetyltransferase/amino-acid acetyltransferase ArgJ [Planctomycetota bacterium]